jgi:hypothetical protein
MVPPFVSVAASSGTGKTQMAFAAPAEYKVIYIPLANGQTIYEPFADLRTCLNSCIEADLEVHHPRKAFVPTDAILPGNDYWVAGLFSLLLDHADFAPGDLLQLKQTIAVKPTTVQKLHEKVVEEKRPIRVILDEVKMLAKKKGSGKDATVPLPKQQMLRSLLRKAGLIVALMSTHSSVFNFIGEWTIRFFISLFFYLFFVHLSQEGQAKAVIDFHFHFHFHFHFYH